MPSQGTSSQRGYNYRHQVIRERLKPFVQSGNAVCWRCGGKIEPDEPFDLGHCDADRSRYMGPEHVRCNRATKGRQAKNTRAKGGADTSRSW